MILIVEEATWRPRSRSIWLSSGDKNTKFFHKYATLRRYQNTIWDIEDETGVLQSSEFEIKKIAFKHFKNQYRSIEAEDSRSQIKVLEHMPKFFNEIESNEIVKVVMIEEVKEIVCSMPKDKSPGPNGWTRELFQNFLRFWGRIFTRPSKNPDVLDLYRVHSKVPSSLSFPR